MLTKEAVLMPQSPQPTPGPREVLTRFQRAAIDKSTDDFANLYAVDGVHEFPFTRPGVPSRLQGREQIRAFAQANWDASPLQYQEYRNVVVHQTADPEVLIVEQEAAGTVTTTGRPFTLPNIIVLKVHDGQIVHLRDYVNVLAVAEVTDRLPALLASITGQRPTPAPPDADS
jgi:uncharacterized protein